MTQQPWWSGRELRQQTPRQGSSRASLRLLLDVWRWRQYSDSLPACVLACLLPICHRCGRFG
jgi:hypothetical protein